MYIAKSQRSWLLQSFYLSGSPVDKMYGNQKVRIIFENSSTKSPKSFFSNRFAFPNKHHVLSSHCSSSMHVPFTRRLWLTSITCTQTQPLFSFYWKCYQTVHRTVLKQAPIASITNWFSWSCCLQSTFKHRLVSSVLHVWSMRPYPVKVVFSYSLPRI